MARVICPKCGWKQDDRKECERCGIVFSRYGSPRTETAAGSVAGPGTRRFFRSFYRAFRWVAIASLVLVLVLLLRNPPPPAVQIDPDAQKRAEAKVNELYAATQEDRPYTLRLDEAELNSWLRPNLSLASKGGEKQTARETDNPEDIRPAVQRVRSTVRDVKIELFDDRVRGYVLFDFLGKDLSLVLEGRLVVENRYLRLQPESGTLGTLPLPQSILKNAAARLFDRPDNRETFHLSPAIRDIRVEHSELIVVRR